jgi:Methyltransferase domain
MLDIPCGDYNWMRAVIHDLENYIGADVVRAIVESNQERYSAPGVSFRQLDVTCDPLPRADLVLCRDCLMHLSNDHVSAAIENVVRSGSTWVALTSFHNSGRNRDTVTGGFRALNLCQPPFNLPPRSRWMNNGRHPAISFWISGRPRFSVALRDRFGRTLHINWP